MQNAKLRGSSSSDVSLMMGACEQKPQLLITAYVLLFGLNSARKLVAVRSHMLIASFSSRGYCSCDYNAQRTRKMDLPTSLVQMDI